MIRRYLPLTAYDSRILLKVLWQLSGMRMKLKGAGLKDGYDGSKPVLSFHGERFGIFMKFVKGR